MAIKNAKTFEEILNMKEKAFTDYVEALGKEEAWAEITERYTNQKVYPKVKKPAKRNPKTGIIPTDKFGNVKMTSQADKTQPPKIVKKPITFVEAKTMFAIEVLGLSAKEEEKGDTFRSRAAAAAAAKRASGK